MRLDMLRSTAIAVYPNSSACYTPMLELNYLIVVSCFEDMVSAQLQLHKYATGRQSRVITSLTMLKQHLFKYQGHVSAALVLGGFDINGPHLFTVRWEGGHCGSACFKVHHFWCAWWRPSRQFRPQAARQWS